MNLKNAAIFLFAGAIVSAFSDVLTNLERFIEVRIDLQGTFFVLVSLFVAAAFALTGKAFYDRSATLRTLRSPGIVLTIACSLWVLYYCWLLGEQIVDGGLGYMAYDYYSWMFFILLHSVTSLILGIAIVSGEPARMRMGGLLACIGAGAWTAWLIFLLLTRVDFILRASDDPLEAIRIFTDFTLPVALFFFGMSLFRSPPGRAKREEVIDEL